MKNGSSETDQMKGEGMAIFIQSHVGVEDHMVLPNKAALYYESQPRYPGIVHVWRLRVPLGSIQLPVLHQFVLQVAIRPRHP